MTNGNLDTKNTDTKFNYKEKPAAVTFLGFLSLLFLCHVANGS